ncbi:ABC transporter permease, partial [Anaerocolumna aminovalerica]
ISSAQPMAGQGYELEAIAAAVLGGVNNNGGEGTIINTIIGALMMGVLRNGLNLMGVSSFWQQIVIGIILVAACAMDVRRQKKNK